uniref:Alpha-2-macroglobulin n=1 Tax=Chelydra serpentina TaxID=8475 RepID=A0A8C3SLY3_CHESE
MNPKRLFCLGFFVFSQAPHATSDPLAFITFSAKGHTVHLSERRSVAIQNVDGVVFIQTDKPIYKPGQTGEWGGGYELIIELGVWMSGGRGMSLSNDIYIAFSVLPKFEVTINAPKRISFLDQELKVNVCAAYTYGQPVQGRVQLSVCRKHYNDRCNETPKGICEAVTAQPTNILRGVSGALPVLYVCRTPWALLFIQIQMENEDGIPVANETIKLELNEKHVADYITNENGTARFSIDTAEFFEPRFKLYSPRWSFNCGRREKQAGILMGNSRFYSRTNSFVKLEQVPEMLSCGQQRRIMVHYILNKEGYRDATTPYGTFFIPLTGSEKLAPTAQILLYTVHPGGELVADSTRLQIEKCFKNKVKLQFSKKQGLPASNISLNLEAAANSYCALRAVDQSVLLLRPEQELSADTVSLVYNQLRVQEYYGYYYNGLNLEDDAKEPCIPVTDTFFNGLYYVPVNVTRDGDVYGIFRVRLLKVSPILLESYVIKTVRKFFPETWIWDLVPIDSNGKASVSFTIPDTITEWKASAFCLEEEAGFGISPSTSLTAFQPFFVDLTLPYSIVRGEKFNLIANVFNYLNKCIEVQYVLSLSFLSNVSFAVTAEAKSSDASQEQGLERVDTVMQLLLVENLLQMPYGCGEQNMVLFAPNIYILDYLNKTGQLTKETESKGIGYLTSGYQKQLSYKHPDGSYSSFGTRDKEGSTWLTAFVYKSFAQAKRYIYIDDNVQSQSLIWLASKQVPDGCFQSVGNHFNNALKVMVRNGLSCLDAASVRNVDNVYYQALLAYTYGLAGNKEKLRFFLKELDKSATKVGGSVHWERKEKPLAEKFPSFNSRAASAEVEMTCYVILALLQRPTLTPEELSYVAQIVQWVAKQQNPYGGFSSTQVNIPSLAQYGYLTFSKDGQNTIEISSKELMKKVFQVDNRNRLLLQQVSLPSLPGNYSVEVKGNGCVYLLSRFSYAGKRSTSNMAIIDVKMLSGFVPVRSSLQKVQEGNRNLTNMEESIFPFSPSVLYYLTPWVMIHRLQDQKGPL